MPAHKKGVYKENIQRKKREKKKSKEKRKGEGEQGGEDRRRELTDGHQKGAGEGDLLQVGQKSVDLFHLPSTELPQGSGRSKGGAPEAEAEDEAEGHPAAKEVSWAGPTAAALWVVQRGIGRG